MDFLEKDWLYFFWKKQWLPSVYGDGYSFLDSFEGILDNVNYSQNLTQIVQNQNVNFGREKEFWLLNRLDNDTWWLLYFASNQDIYDEYKSLQKSWKISKIYIADVQGKFSFDKTIIVYPIMHHKHLDDRMVAVKSSKYLSKCRGKQNICQTYVQNLYYNEEMNTSTLMVSITKWVRHQIRVHLSSIGYPIIWDRLYSKIKSEENLHLRSIWLQIS